MDSIEKISRQSNNRYTYVILLACNIFGKEIVSDKKNK